MDWNFFFLICVKSRPPKHTADWFFIGVALAQLILLESHSFMSCRLVLPLCFLELQEHTVRRMHCPPPPPLSLTQVVICRKTADRGSPIPPDTQCSSCLVYHTDSDFFSGPTLITTQLLHCSCLAHNGISTKVCIPLLSGDGRGVQESERRFFSGAAAVSDSSVFLIKLTGKFCLHMFKVRFRLHK